MLGYGSPDLACTQIRTMQPSRPVVTVLNVAGVQLYLLNKPTESIEAGIKVFNLNVFIVDLIEGSDGRAASGRKWTVIVSVNEAIVQKGRLGEVSSEPHCPTAKCFNITRHCYHKS